MEYQRRAGIYKTDIENWFYIISSYDADFVQSLKNHLPPSMRRWDPMDKIWLIHELYLDDAIELMDQYFDDYEIDIPEPLQNQNQGPYGILFLLPNAPNELVKSAYRTLSMRYHPDKGGSTETMARLNQAYEDIKNERGLT